MIVEIIRSEEGYAIGWTMKGENDVEISKLGTIRDLQFWGLDETVIEYNGRINSDDANNNPGELSWVQKGQRKK